VERVAGAGIVATVVASSACAGWLLCRVARRVHPVAGFAFESLLCYQLLAARSLQDESMPVYDALARGDLSAARLALAMIVGRDVDSLDEAGIARAAVETVAENASDGVVAPLLAMGAVGLPGMLSYKAINTLDSMIGYKNERYLHLGWAAAKLDDLANFMPARVAGSLMCLAAAPAGLDARSAWRVFTRDRLKHASPNAGHTEAACAGALGVQLGGTSYYFGKPVEKPVIGDDARPIEPQDIVRANRLMRATSLLGLAAATLLACVASRIRR
jgi:adenosylcobinamide-phosphate synthase